MAFSSTMDLDPVHLQSELHVTAKKGRHPPLEAPQLVRSLLREGAVTVVIILYNFPPCDIKSTHIHTKSQNMSK